MQNQYLKSEPHGHAGSFDPVDFCVFSKVQHFFCLLDLLLDDDSFCFNHTEQMPVHLILIGFCIKVLIPI
ncbi:hypothetical protein HanLR1_Chr07g0239531 [Helianthus annuus]|nr:hypothetical protein HanLR1_Chr07g0239531 [Helianthus annuus]